MKLLAQVRSWCKWLTKRSRLESEMDRELQFHIDCYAADLVQGGVPREEALRQARLELGAETQKAAVRSSIGLRLWDELRTDLRCTVRMMRRNPGLVTVAVLSLALGIGANTAIFSVLNAVVLRPFPYPHPERLVSLSERTSNLSLMYIALPNLDDWRAMNTVFDSIEGFRANDVTLTGDGSAQRLSVRQVSAGFFTMLGIAPILGRPILTEDDRREAKPVVLLSDSLWAREFARDPRVLNKQLILDGERYTVIGVVPSSRCHMLWRQIDVFTPLGLMEGTMGGPTHRDVHRGLWAYARLKAGVTLEQARADMDSVARRLEKRYPSTNLDQRVNVKPLQESLMKDASRRLALLMGAVVLVLLIACGNVATLLMSLAIVRRREIAVRSALGAGATRLARQYLCESMLLALMGGAVGLLLAYAATASLAHLAAASLPRIEEVSIDRATLLATLAVSLLTGVVFGVFPALMALRVDPNDVLKDESHGSRMGLTRMGARSVLAASQLALSLVLLVATGLTLKSLVHLFQTDLGFRVQGVLTGSLSLPPTKYASADQRGKFVEDLLSRVGQLPGVKAAGFSNQLLGGAQTDFHIEGRAAPQPGQEPYVEISRITPGTLESLGVQLLSGRFLNSGDGPSTPLVCLVDDNMAQQYWPGENPLGKRVNFDFVSSMGLQHSWWTVIGVIHHLKLYGPANPILPEAFLSYQQLPSATGNIVLSSDLPGSSLEGMVREVLFSLDNDLPLYDVSSLEELTDGYVAPQKLSTVLLGIFAAIALLLAAVGTYGAMRYMVAGRTQEIGVRRALGATPLDITRLVLSQWGWLVLSGLTLGVLLSLAVGRLIVPFLFGVKASDPLTFATVSGVLIVVAAMACYFPARKATRLQPIEAVRHE